MDALIYKPHSMFYSVGPETSEFVPQSLPVVLSNKRIAPLYTSFIKVAHS